MFLLLCVSSMQTYTMTPRHRATSALAHWPSVHWQPAQVTSSRVHHRTPSQTCRDCSPHMRHPQRQVSNQAGRHRLEAELVLARLLRGAASSHGSPPIRTADTTEPRAACVPNPPPAAACTIRHQDSPALLQACAPLLLGRCAPAPRHRISASCGGRASTAADMRQDCAITGLRQRMPQVAG